LSLEIGDYKKILIPIDGSDHSIRAAEMGISLAKLLGASITFAYVIDTLVLDRFEKEKGLEQLEHELNSDGERYIKYVSGLAEKTGLMVASLITKGIPFEQILKLQKELQTDLIVMGSSGRRGADRILIGSVAQHVIEYATCPVLVVK
jgi:nucleotide-binding universal stress UspA family protein